MTWTLTASGHAPVPDGEATSNAVELELLAELRAVLSQPKYGARVSLLRGTHVMSTALHQSPAQSASAPAAQVEPEAASEAEPDGAHKAVRRARMAAAAGAGGE